MSLTSNLRLSDFALVRRTCLTALLATSLLVGASAARAAEQSATALQVQIAPVQIAQANEAGGEIWDPIEPVNRYFF